MIHLRPYQQAAVEHVAARWREQVRRILLVAATGAGKTILAARFILGAAAKGKRALFLVHRREIIAQAWGKIVEAGVDASEVGVIMGDGRITHPVTRKLFDARRPGARVQVASVQTLAARAKRDAEGRIVGTSWPAADLVFADEAHHCVSAQWSEVLGHYRAAGATVIGLTATPERADGRGLDEHFDELHLVATPAELMDAGYLVRPRIFAPETAPDLKGITVRAGDYAPGELAAACDRPTLVGDLVAHYQRRGGGQRAVVFAAGVEHSRHIVETFRAAGIVAEHLDGKTPADERDAILTRLREGTTRVVSNVGVLTEGWDEPLVGCVILARPTKSLGLYLQCLDAQTEILTERGFLGPDALADTDRVAAFDIDTAAVSWQPILRRVDRQIAEGERMFAARGPGIDLRVTGGHRMVFKARTTGPGGRRWPDAWRIETAAELARRGGVRIPCAGYQSASGAPLTDDELRFIGWFLTDGTLHGATNAITITQANHQPQIEDLRRCIEACGFKYSAYAITPKGFANGRPQTRFAVCKGAPRGRDKHLRGWGSLAPYIDKDFSPRLEDLDDRQLAVLLHAIHLGDGNKQAFAAADGWTPGSYHVVSVRPLFVERLQSLCVRRGWRCNVATYDPPCDDGKRKRQYFLHIKKQDYRTLGGATERDKTRLVEVATVPGERVWCVENPLGTLIVRRGGKVAVVGNCAGRGLRPAPGKSAVLLDHAGCWEAHGAPQDAREWSLEGKPRRPSAGGEAKTHKKCPACRCVVERAEPVCPECGYRWSAAECRIPESVAGELQEVTEAMRVARETERQRKAVNRLLGRHVGRLCDAGMTSADAWTNVNRAVWQLTRKSRTKMSGTELARLAAELAEPEALERLAPVPAIVPEVPAPAMEHLAEPVDVAFDDEARPLAFAEAHRHQLAPPARVEAPEETEEAVAWTL